MDVTASGCPACTGDPADTTTAYRVVLWEHPIFDGAPSESTGWAEAGFDLTGAVSVREVIAWAEEQLAAGAGYWTQRGQPVRDREYVVYARVPGEQTLIQIAGWDPHMHPDAPNFPRLR